MKLTVSAWMTLFAWLFSILLFAQLPLTNAGRGPHHPRGTPQSHPDPHHHHHHYVPQRHDTGHSQGHGQHGSVPKLTQDKQLLHDMEHLKEDLGEWAFTDGKQLSPEEMEFHYFKMHDFDNNSKLDGLEILKAISHVLPMTEVEHPDPHLNANQQQEDHIEYLKRTGEAAKQREADFNYYIDLIDKVLEDDDLDKDGYLSYAEYAVGRRRDEEQLKKGSSSS